MPRKDRAARHYRVIPKDPVAHLFEVTCTIEHPDPDGQTVSIPAWIPGSYMIRDFARNVVRFEARDAADRPIPVTRPDKSTWRCAPCSGPLQLRLEIYAWELSVRAAHLDQTHGYFNGTSLFPRVHGQETAPCTVDLEPPAGAAYADWRVATTLPRAGAEPLGFGRYTAADYDELIDHPVEMGRFAHAHFEAGGVPHEIAIYGRQRADLERLTRDLKQICETHIAMFGELPPMERYLFLVTAVGDGYGGLEHRSSCSLICRRDDLPRPDQPELSDGYRTFLGLCSHEYFHTWNVKRIKPAAFMPYDLTRETYTRQLWAFEGFTSYYDDLGLLRSGLVELPGYLELLGQTATRVWRGSGRFKQSVAESSLEAWTKFYRQDENAPNAIVSYYTKGALVALALDLTLRRLGEGRTSLDDLMRKLWLRHGKPGVGVPEGGIEALAEELAGQDLGEFFARYVYGTEDPPLADLLADLGIDFVLRPAEGADDRGGKPATRKPEAGPRAVLGARIGNGGGDALLSQVFEGGAAQRAGLSAGDVVIAVDGLRVNASSLERVIASYPVASVVDVHAFRRDELMHFQVRLEAAPADTCVFIPRAHSSAEQLARRAAWMQSDSKPEAGERHAGIA